MTEVWLDTNVVLRFVLGEPSDLHRKAERLMRRAAEGEIVARVSHVTLAEAIWVLGSSYDREASSIAEILGAFIRADGIAVDDADTVLTALRVMVDRRVAFVDAYLAVAAGRAGQPVATFDKDFRRLGVELLELS